jgi:maltose-binding protein MalE
LILSSILFILIGCGTEKEENKIVIWTGMNTEKELKMMNELGKEFEKNTGVKVDIIPIPFGDLQNKFQIAAPARQGPDLITGPQDWVGIFAAANLVSPMETYVNKEEQKKFMPVSIEGATYENKLYAIPLSFESVALIYNTEAWCKINDKTIKGLKGKITDEEIKNIESLKDQIFQESELSGKLKKLSFKEKEINIILDYVNKEIISKPPSTMEELIKEAKKFTLTKGEGDRKVYERYGFLGNLNDLFVVFPIFSGCGAYVFKDISDPTNLGLNNDGAKKAARMIYNMRDYVEGGFIPEGITGDRVLGTFIEGKTAMIINGPWAINELDKVGRKYEVCPLPPFEDGQVPRPFVGILGIMLNRFAKNPEPAVKFMVFMNNKENQVKIYKALNRIPARIEALETPEVQGDKKIMGFYLSAKNGIPLPSLPVMSSVWDPMVQSLTLITTEKRENPDKFIEDQLNTAVKRIQNNIKRLLK